MNKAELLSTLESLHAQLQSAGSIDDETRSLLAALTEDIQRLTQGDQDAGETANFSERIQELTLKFESEHPQITEALNQVSSALANLGI